MNLSYHPFKKSQPFFRFFDTLFAKKQGRHLPSSRF